jgi:hypothetical protein
MYKGKVQVARHFQSSRGDSRLAKKAAAYALCVRWATCLPMISEALARVLQHNNAAVVAA